MVPCSRICLNFLGYPFLLWISNRSAQHPSCITLNIYGLCWYVLLCTYSACTCMVVFCRCRVTFTAQVNLRLVKFFWKMWCLAVSVTRGEDYFAVPTYPVHQRRHLCGCLWCALRAARSHAVRALHQLNHLHQQGWCISNQFCSGSSTSSTSFWKSVEFLTLSTWLECVQAAVLVTLLFMIAVNLAIGILPHMMRPTPWSTSRRARLPQHPDLNEPSGRRPCPARGAGGGGAHLASHKGPALYHHIIGLLQHRVQYVRWPFLSRLIWWSIVACRWMMKCCCECEWVATSLFASLP